MQWRKNFQQSVARPDSAALFDAVAAAKRGDASGRLKIASALAWVAYSCPDATDAVYDNLAAAWLENGEAVDVPGDFPEAPLEDSFWDAYWGVVDGAKEGYDAISITVAVAALAGDVHESFGEIAENHARKHPGAAAALTRPVPGHTDIAALKSCPEGSLGRELHDLLVDNGYDAEVLDRNAIMLYDLPPSLRYLNIRILQMHDVWHLVAGYETTGSQEIAISAFQLAQFGHNYSAMFLAAGTMISHTMTPQGFCILMQIISEAWQHGRQTPVMMDIEWEEEWNHSLAQIREKYGISTLRTVFPADIMEAMTDGTFLRKVGLGYRLVQFNRSLRKGQQPRALV